MCPHSDGLADSLALVEVIRRDDEHTANDCAVILRHANAIDMALYLARLLAVICRDQELDPVDLRRWAAEVMRRP